MTYYKAVRNTIVDDTGKQVAVIMPTNCTKKLAAEMAAYAAQQANVAERNKLREAAKRAQAKRMGDFPVDYGDRAFLECNGIGRAPYRFGLIDQNYVLCWAPFAGQEKGGSLRDGRATAGVVFGQAAVDAYVKENPVASSRCMHMENPWKCQHCSPFKE